MTAAPDEAECRCPICSDALEQREVAPCCDCGGDPRRLEELALGVHEYSGYTVFGQRLVLCGSCDADFGSYFPEYFGWPGGPCGSYHGLECHEIISNPQPEVDGSCANCRHRRAFLLFLQAARSHSASVGAKQDPQL